MAKIQIWPVNLSTTLTKLDIWQFQLPVAAKDVTRALAEQVLEDSHTRVPFVPEDTGDLASTGRVEKAPGGYAVMYGGASDNGKYVDYANQVHDDLRPRIYTRPGSGPKFVETHYLIRTSDAEGDFDQTLRALAVRIFGT